MAERRSRVPLGTPSMFTGRGAPPPVTPPGPAPSSTPDDAADVSSPAAAEVSRRHAGTPARIAPGARSGHVAVVRRAGTEPVRSLEADLDETLQFLCHGEPLGPALARKAEREARALLLRRGLAAARVAALIDAGAVVLHVELPPETPRVRSLVVRVGG